MNDQLIQNPGYGILYGHNPLTLTPRQSQKYDFKSFLKTKHFLVRESFFETTSNRKVSLIAFDLFREVIFCDTTANNDLRRKETDPIGEPLDTFAPLFRKPNPRGDIMPSSWEDLAAKGFFIGLKFKRYLQLSNGLIFLIALTGSPLFDNSGDIVGGVCLYQKLKHKT